MKKIVLVAVILLIYPGLTLKIKAQTAADFERTGLKHLDNAYFKALPQKNNTKAKAEFALAERAFKQAIEMKPNRVESYLHLGRTYFVQKKYHRAAEVYQKALDLAPHDKKLYIKLASALEMAGDYKGAVKTLQDLRAQETDQRVVRILDNFIHKIEMRTTDKKQESQ